MSHPPCFLSSNLTNLAFIQHGFFTRKGGVSSTPYKSLNAALHANDNPQNVIINRQRITNSFQTKSQHALLVTGAQCHSTHVEIVTKENYHCLPPCDALITQTPHIILGILTADCGPVLLADPHARIIAAVHAGWKGAFHGILENTLEKMCLLGAKIDQISASLGPCIHQNSYEVTEDFRKNFIQKNPHYADYFLNGCDFQHFYFDLPRFILDRLLQKGIKATNCNLCTYSDEENFFSYRRATHRQEIDYGRQMSAIMLDLIG